MFFADNLPVAFADGHAKAIQWKGGQGDPAAEHHEFNTPSNLSLITDYCSDPNILVDTSGDSNGSGGNQADGEESFVPTGTTCAMLPAIFANLPTLPAGSSTRSYWPN
jgi:prepilin-type processing-associated H-X9-DG protein